KFELYSKAFQEFGYEPLPEYVEPPESPISTPDLYADYPLVFTSGSRMPIYTHSELRQIQWMREIRNHPELEIHPETAKDLGIEDGEWVYAETQRGRALHRARYSLVVDPRVVHGEHGWWYPEELGEGADIDHLTRMNINNTVPGFTFGKQGYASPYRSSLCRVYPAKKEAM
ncbi:MAG: dehydrogenase, partial [Candidatus Hydrogenedentes bacterium]|nr:dehydrogenase [Candidatus Hydrogenedentota bacterium]